MVLVFGKAVEDHLLQAQVVPVVKGEIVLPVINNFKFIG